uniref:Viral late gene transcription factor 3 zinc ribbon domain-containing protein n=1 Tax=viral metagenome TaxID=1070528 RepID=A0A6C0AQ24_9ZZZZ
MPSFKPKTNKKIKYNKQSAITLDIKHKEFLNEFSKDENDRIPNLKIERHELKQQLLEDLTIEQQLEITDKINEISQQIKEIKSRKKGYFLDNSKFIFDYFENKKNISDGNKVQVNSNKTKLVNTFFKIKPENENFKLAQRENSNIVKNYLSNIDDGFLDVNSFVYQTDICHICNKGELIPLDDEGILVCTSCSRVVPYLIENEKPSYKEPPKEVCFYAYKRINHFKEILAQFQGKETTQIPLDVIENIKLQIKKERIELSQITNIKTKEILKKLGYNKYYEHIPFIKDKLGIKPPIMSPELEETLCNLFIELQSPYSKFCPDDRVNFLNYYYTAYKLCELLGEEQYLAFFPMLKDPEKRMEQDEIWKKICLDLDWEFIPTI